MKGESISDLEIKKIGLDAKTMIYQMAHKHISNAEAYHRFDEIGNTVKRILKLKY